MTAPVQEFDLVQRIRVENGVPRLVSTTFKVIEGGEDLLSLAIAMLKQMGVYDKFEENRTSQYIGYRLKNPPIGEKKYKLILFPKKGSLSISLNSELYSGIHLDIVHFDRDLGGEYLLGRIFVFPSKEDIFLNSVSEKYSPYFLNGEVAGEKDLYWSSKNNKYYVHADQEEYEVIGRFNIEQITEELSSGKDYLVLPFDNLFPYAWQTSISSSEALNEFLSYFIPILMEK